MFLIVPIYTTIILIYPRYYKSRNNSKGLNYYLIGVRIELLAKRTD